MTEISQMQQFLPNFWASKLNERVRLPSRQLGLSLTFSGIRHRPFLRIQSYQHFENSCERHVPSTIAAAQLVRSRFFAPLEQFI